ncbi:MAG: hypothetical protein RDU89_09700 [bacterium]|nr:hypothetical protein [bacterium]
MALGTAIHTTWFAVLQWRDGNRLAGVGVLVLAAAAVAVPVYLLWRGF